MLGGAYGSYVYATDPEIEQVEVRVQVNDRNVTELLLNQSLTIEASLETRGTCEFIIVDLTKQLRFVPGQSVYVIYKDSLVFSGTIDEPEETTVEGEQTNYIQCTCVDRNQLAERFLVNKIYVGKTIAEIVTNIVGSATDPSSATRLWEEGVTLGMIETGIVTSRISLPYRRVSEVFNELADLAGMVWWIDAYKKLNFVSKNSYKSPFVIGDTAETFSNLVYKQSRSSTSYRNRQVVRANKDRTDPLPDKFVGDGKRKTFNLGYPIAQLGNGTTIPEPVNSATPSTAVLRNGSPQTVGVKGQDKDNTATGPQWFYEKSTNEITQNSHTSFVPLSTAEELFVTYIGQFSITLEGQNDAEISTRKGVEGGTGIYENVVEENDIEGKPLATEYLESLLRIYGKIPKEVNFIVYSPGLWPGQIMSGVVLADHGVASTEFLVQNVEYNLRAANVGSWEIQIRALDGERVGFFYDFFVRSEKAGRKFGLRENEVVSDAAKFAEQLQLSDELSYESGNTLDDPYTDEYTYMIIMPNETVTSADPATWVIGIAEQMTYTVEGKPTRPRGSKVHPS